jgi:hypothetical protein
VIALVALHGGVVDGRALLPPLALAVAVGGFGLGRLLVRLVPDRRDPGR